MIKINKLKIFLSLYITSLLCSCNGYDKQLSDINITETIDNSTQSTISEKTTNNDIENTIAEKITEDTDFEQVTFSGDYEYLNDTLQDAIARNMNMNFKGYGKNVDYDEALKYYSMSAEQNFPQGICSLAYMNLKGYGKDVDYDKAYKLFLKAAGGLDSDAILNIGHMYNMGLD